MSIGLEIGSKLLSPFLCCAGLIEVYRHRSAKIV